MSTPDRHAALRSVADSVDHFERLARRRMDLERLQQQTEEQILNRLDVEYSAGRLTEQDLWEAQQALRPYATSGLATRWNAAVRITYQRIHLMGRTGFPETECQGPRDDMSQAPLNGVNVVYVLYDADLMPCYLGSTGAFRDRLREHRRKGKAFAHWRAYRCTTRDDAYRRESEMLREVMPYLNRRV